MDKRIGVQIFTQKTIVIYSSQEAFYPGGKEPPSTSVVRDIGFLRDGFFTIVTAYRDHLFPGGFTCKRGVTQNNELLVHIA